MFKRKWVANVYLVINGVDDSMIISKRFYRQKNAARYTLYANQIFNHMKDGGEADGAILETRLERA